MKIIKKLINKTVGLFGVSLVPKNSLRNDSTQLPKNTVDQIQFDSNTSDNLSMKALLQHQINMKWSIVDLIESVQIKDSLTTCPLCEVKLKIEKLKKLHSTCIFEGGTLVRYQCPECDLIFGPDKMFKLTESELSEDYKWHYRAFSEGDSTDLEKKAFYALNPTKDGIYLNWGAGDWSRTIQELRSEGWCVFGFEPFSSTTVNNRYIITNKEQLIQMRFDGIFSNNVLEHLRYPVRDLIEMSTLLNSEGKMSHATPCFEYLYEFTRFHLFFYPGRSRALLAKKSKLRILDFISEDHYMNIIFTRDLN